MSIARLPCLLIVAALAACASAPPAQDATTGGHQPAQPAPGRCNADAVQWAIGKPNDQATFDRVWKESGAGLVRPITPKQAVTMDYREDRVNLHLDNKNLITRVTCG